MGPDNTMPEGRNLRTVCGFMLANKVVYIKDEGSICLRNGARINLALPWLCHDWNLHLSFITALCRCCPRPLSLRGHCSLLLLGGSTCPRQVLLSVLEELTVFCPDFSGLLFPFKFDSVLIFHALSILWNPFFMSLGQSSHCQVSQHRSSEYKRN